jgi:hypothetical protein
VLTFLIATSSKFSDGAKGFKDGKYGMYYSQNRPLITGKYYKTEKTDLWTFYYYPRRKNCRRFSAVNSILF